MSELDKFEFEWQKLSDDEFLEKFPALFLLAQTPEENTELLRRRREILRKRGELK